MIAPCLGDDRSRLLNGIRPLAGKRQDEGRRDLAHSTCWALSGTSCLEILKRSEPVKPIGSAAADCGTKPQLAAGTSGRERVSKNYTLRCLKNST